MQKTPRRLTTSLINKEQEKPDQEQVMRDAKAGLNVAQDAITSGGMHLLKGAADKMALRVLSGPDNETMERSQDQIEQYKHEVKDLKKGIKTRNEQLTKDQKSLELLAERRELAADPVYWNLQYIEPDPISSSYKKYAESQDEGWVTGLDLSNFQEAPGRACLDLTKLVAKTVVALNVCCFTAALYTCGACCLCVNGKTPEGWKKDKKFNDTLGELCGCVGVLILNIRTCIMTDVCCATPCCIVPGCNCADFMQESALYERENRLRVHMEKVQKANDKCAKSFVDLVRTSIEQVNKLLPKYALRPFPTLMPDYLHCAAPIKSSDARAPLHDQNSEDAH